MSIFRVFGSSKKDLTNVNNIFNETLNNQLLEIIKKFIIKNQLKYSSIIENIFNNNLSNIDKITDIYYIREHCKWNVFEFLNIC